MAKRKAVGRRTRLRWTAFHEAGHVIACDELNVMYLWASIEMDDDTLGRVSAEGGDGVLVPTGMAPDDPVLIEMAQKQALDHAAIEYAGHAAVVAVLGQGRWTDRSARAHGARADFDRAAERLVSDPALIEKAKLRAMTIVTRRMNDVRAVAEALLERTWLCAQQVDWVLAGRDLDEHPVRPRAAP